MLTLNSVFLHFLDFGNRLAQVVGELLAVLGVGGVEVDEDFDVRAGHGRRQSDAIGIICSDNGGEGEGEGEEREISDDLTCR